MYQFTVHGIPIAQKQTRFTMIGGYPRAYDPSKKDKERIQWQIRPFAPEKPLEGPVELTIAFFLPIPKSTSKRLREQMINRVILPAKKPDEDNLAYLVTNALKEIVYKDDAQICAKHVYKFYGLEPKTVIRVRPILQAEQVGYQNAADI
jgi:Holliday junction resolvase RusA-like endonuclease